MYRRTNRINLFRSLVFSCHHFVLFSLFHGSSIRCHLVWDLVRSCRPMRVDGAQGFAFALEDDRNRNQRPTLLPGGSARLSVFAFRSPPVTSAHRGSLLFILQARISGLHEICPLSIYCLDRRFGAHLWHVKHIRDATQN